MFPSMHHTDTYSFQVVHKACKYIGAPSRVCPQTTESHSFPARASRFSHKHKVKQLRVKQTAFELKKPFSITCCGKCKPKLAILPFSTHNIQHTISWPRTSPTVKSNNIPLALGYLAPETVKSESLCHCPKYIWQVAQSS